MIRLNVVFDTRVVGTEHYSDSDKEKAVDNAKAIQEIVTGEFIITLYHCADEHSPSDELILSLKGGE